MFPQLLHKALAFCYLLYVNTDYPITFSVLGHRCVSTKLNHTLWLWLFSRRWEPSYIGQSWISLKQRGLCEGDRASMNGIWFLSRPASKCYSAKTKTLWGNLDDHEFWDSMVFGHVSYPKFFTKKCWWNFRIHPIWNHYNPNRAYVSNRGSFNLPSEIYQQV